MDDTDDDDKCARAVQVALHSQGDDDVDDQPRQNGLSLILFFALTAHLPLLSEALSFSRLLSSHSIAIPLPPSVFRPSLLISEITRNNCNLIGVLHGTESNHGDLLIPAIF